MSNEHTPRSLFIALYGRFPKATSIDAALDLLRVQTPVVFSSAPLASSPPTSSAGSTSGSAVTNVPSAGSSGSSASSAASSGYNWDDQSMLALLQGLITLEMGSHVTFEFDGVKRQRNTLIATSVKAVVGRDLDRKAVSSKLQQLAKTVVKLGEGEEYDFLAERVPGVKKDQVKGSRRARRQPGVTRRLSPQDKRLLGL